MSRPTIFFDFDGTLLNSFSLYFQTTKRLFPDISEEAYRDIFTLPNFHSSPTILQENKAEFFNLIAQHMHLYDIFPNVLEGLYDLAREYDLVLVTACPKRIAIDQLSRFELPRFQKVYGLEKAGNKHEKISHYCANYRDNTTECYFVTDTLGDLLQVAPLPLTTLAVTYGFHDHDTLAQGNPTFICDNFKQVVENLLNKKPEF